MKMKEQTETFSEKIHIVVEREMCLSVEEIQW